MNYLDLIEKRQSIRDFTGKSVDIDRIRELKEAFTSFPTLCPDTALEMLIVDKAGTSSRLEGVVGYRGNAFNAPAYIILLSEKKDFYLENAGFVAENIVLKLEDMELSSCFLTADNSDVVKKALLIESELYVACVIAFGYGKKERNITRLDIKTPSDVRVNKREGHIAPKISTDNLAFDTAFGNPMDFNEEVADPFLTDALYAASLSPSFLNRQAYRFIVDGRHIYLFDKNDELTSENDRHLDLGIVMFNFYIILASRFSGINNWKLSPLNVKAGFNLPAGYGLIASLDL